MNALVKNEDKAGQYVYVPSNPASNDNCGCGSGCGCGGGH